MEEQVPEFLPHNIFMISKAVYSNDYCTVINTIRATTLATGETGCLELGIPFQLSCKEGLYNSTIALLDEGVDPNLQILGSTPLVIAVSNNHVDIARALLEHGVDPNCPSDISGSPLKRSVYKRNLDMTRLLLEYGAKPYVGCHPPGPIERAVNNGDIEILRELLGSLECSTGDWGLVPSLMKATINNDICMMDLLLDYTSINVMDDDGKTALWHAIVYGSSECVIEYLLERGASPIFRSLQGGERSLLCDMSPRLRQIVFERRDAIRGALDLLPSDLVESEIGSYFC